MNIWKSIEEYTVFLFMGHSLWKENSEDSKIIGIKRFKLLCKLTMANLCKIGLKVRE